MKKLFKALAISAVLGTAAFTASANAWWGMPGWGGPGGYNNGYNNNFANLGSPSGGGIYRGYRSNHGYSDSFSNYGSGSKVTILD